MKSRNQYKNYNTFISFEKSMIAPCGMNCGTCIAYMRPKNKCSGCRLVEQGKARVNCIIRNCDLLSKTDSKFCFDCHKYPCKRLRELDNRYRTKYNTSFLDNLIMIKEKGIDFFLDFEADRRKCPRCGATLSVHRNHCLDCMGVLE